MLGVYTAAISGAHINSAVTLTNIIFRKFPLKKSPIYLVAQVLEGFATAGVLYGNYKSAIVVFEGGVNIRTVPGYSDTATAGIFATYPAALMTKTAEFFSEFIAILFFGIGGCFGWETGFAINHVRDFGPRLMTYCLGYGFQVWTSNGQYFWAPMMTLFCGCLMGAFLSDTFLYTGKSPINTPWMGLRELLRRKPQRSRSSPYV